MSSTLYVAPHTVRLAVVVEIDPLMHGFDLTDRDAAQLVISAINTADGLHVVEPTED